MATTPNITASHTSRGITLLETVLSLLILGGAFVAALNTIASARASQGVAAERQLAMVLAEDLMSEILSQPNYKEGASFGPELGENTGNRTSFDDLDDYKGWSSTPPTDAAGNAIAGADDYTRVVQVVYTKLQDPSTVALTDEGMLYISVKVKRGGKTVARLYTYRSDNWPSPGEVK